jgi:hypothetical protein
MPTGERAAELVELLGSDSLKTIGDNEGLGLRHRETDQHGTTEPSGDDRNAAENPGQGRNAGVPGEASER